MFYLPITPQSFVFLKPNKHGLVFIILGPITFQYYFVFDNSHLTSFYSSFLTRQITFQYFFFAKNESTNHTWNFLFFLNQSYLCLLFFFFFYLLRLSLLCFFFFLTNEISILFFEFITSQLFVLFGPITSQYFVFLTYVLFFQANQKVMVNHCKTNQRLCALPDFGFR